MGGEPNFDGQANSLRLSQNDIGDLIYRAIQAMLGRSGNRRRRLSRSFVAGGLTKP